MFVENVMSLVKSCCVRRYAAPRTVCERVSIRWSNFIKIGMTDSRNIIKDLLSQLSTSSATINSASKTRLTEDCINPGIKQHQNLQLIKQLVDEQRKVEDTLLKGKDRILHKIKQKRNEIDCCDIVGNDPKSLLRELNQLIQEENNYSLYIMKELNDLRKKQQKLLQNVGMPMFKVSDEPSDLRNMFWVLAPYLDQIKASI